jgi:non-specific serine/threonine protein kinase
MSDDKTPNVATTSSTGGHPASHAALPKGTRLQEFEVVEVIGEGGFGIVYLADDLQLHRSVAVKEYMPASLASRGSGESVIVRSEQNQDTFQAGMRSFISEARMLAQFKHSALIEVFRFWEQNGTAYMAMPYYKGRTLRQVLHDDSHMIDERWLKSLFSPLMDALDLMHAQNVYHRDVAPDNILILGNGAPVLLDLGAARRIIGDLTQAVTVVLKPGYAPIEQYADDGSATQGPWTDIYAIGAVLYFAITGRAPVASVSRIMKDTLKPLDSSSYPGYSDEFLAGIGRALAVKPEDRPQSIAELREVLGISSYAATTMMPSPTTQSRIKKEVPPPTAAQPAVAAVQPKPADALPTDALPAAAAASGAATPTTQPSQPSKVPPSGPVTQAHAPAEAFDISSLNFGAPGDSPALDESSPAASPKAGAAKPELLRESASLPKPDQKSRAPLLVGLVAGIAALGFAGFMFLGGDANIDKPSTPPTEPSVVAGPSQTDTATVPPAPPALEPAITPSASATAPAAAPLARPEPPSIAVRPETLPATKPSTATPMPPVGPQASDSVRPGTLEDADPVPKAEQQVAETGVVKFRLQPWGEVWVDGVKRGPSPPLRSIKLPVGSHRIELRNPGLPTMVKRIQVKKGATVTVEHHFSSESSSAGY